MNAICRLARRLFCWAMVAALLAGVLQADGVNMTAIHDVIYRADGTPAHGMLLITWPAFTTADNKPVAAGSLSMAIAEDGEVDLSLAPNAGATPGGSFYKVLVKSGSETSTEYWTVPATTSTTIAAIRTSVVPSSVAMQMASREYVDGLLKNVPSDSTVVHVKGTETIAGTKQFSVPPSVPSPVTGSDAVNKAYVDAAVVGVGDGSYVRKGGDVMTGPLTLNSDPTSPNQASNRHYVDAQISALSGQISAGSSNATQIQGVPVDPATPQDGQVVTFEATSGKYKPKPPAGGSSGNATQLQSVNVDSTVPTLGQVLFSDGSKWKPQAVSNKDIVDEGKFKDGIGKIIDGSVDCLNASVWAKAK
jgi:hypothetical protein